MPTKDMNKKSEEAERKGRVGEGDSKDEEGGRQRLPGLGHRQEDVLRVPEASSSLFDKRSTLAKKRRCVWDGSFTTPVGRERSPPCARRTEYVSTMLRKKQVKRNAPCIG